MPAITRRFVLTASAAILTLSATVATAQRLLADFTGTWIISAQSPQGSNESTAVLKQEGTTLSGTLDIPQFGSAKIAGTVKGDTVKFDFSLTVEGNAIPVTVSGVAKDKDNMAGSIYLPGDMGNYPFTAKRKP